MYILDIKKYRVIMFIVLLLVISLTLSAGTIIANGTGKNLEEAKLAAQLELASQLTIKVSSKQRLMTSEYVTSNKTTSKELLYQDTTILVDKELLGVKYKDQLAERNSFTITAYIDESSLSQYLQKLSSLKRNIDEIEQRNMSELGLETRRNNLAVLLRYYEHFEAYSTIAKTLNSEAIIPQLLKTKAGAELDYLAALNMEGKLLQSDLDELKSDSAISIDNAVAQQDAKIKMLEIVQKIEANQRQMQAWDLEQKERNQELLQLSTASMQKSVEAMSNKADRMKASIKKRPGGNDPLQLIRKIEDNKQTYQKIQTDFEIEYKKQSYPVQVRYEAAIEKIKSAPYRTAEMEGGLPTDNAKYLKAQSISVLKDRMGDEIEGVRTSLQRSIQKQQDTLLQAVYSEYQNLESKMFTSTSMQDEVLLKVGTYNGYRKSWPVAVRFSLLEKQFAYDMYIPYEKVTGLPLPSFALNSQAEIDAYNQYLDQVDLFEAYFSSTKVPLVVEIKYQIAPSKNPSEYKIIPKSANLIRSDTGSHIFTYVYDQWNHMEQFFSFTPKTDIQTEKEYWFKKETQQAIEEKTAFLKNSKKAARKAKLDLASIYYKQGLFLHLGWAIVPVTGLTSNIGVGTYIAVSGHYTPINNLYLGMSLGGSLIPYTDSGGYHDFLYVGVGLYPHIGLVFPLENITEEGVLKVFGDISLGVNMDGIFGSVLNIGVALDDLFEAAIRVQLSGEERWSFSLSIGLNIIEFYKLAKFDNLF